VIGLATPVALAAGLNKAARNHILIRDTSALEQMRNVDVVVFDKTGTLTEGHPTVIGWLWAQGQEDHYKDVLLAAESTSDHPLAEAIVTALEGEEQVIPAHLDGFESIAGKGVRVAYQGAEYWVGSHKLLKDYQADAI
jgi:P-type E1-E2 ATPase